MNVLVTRDKVQRFLSDLVSNIGIDNNGKFTFRHGSARLFIDVRAHGKDDGSTLVTITCPLVFSVPRSPELYRFIATGSTYYFGHLRAVDVDAGVTVAYEHTLLGDYLDPEELKWAVGAMAGTADDLDTEIQQKFGGELYHED